MSDMHNIERVVVGYEKHGRRRMMVEFALLPVDISFLRKLFNIDPEHSDAAERNMIYCYRLNDEQANALQSYVKEKIDSKKYTFRLECNSL